MSKKKPQTIKIQPVIVADKKNSLSLDGGAVLAVELKREVIASYSDCFVLSPQFHRLDVLYLILDELTHVSIHKVQRYFERFASRAQNA